MFKTTTRAAITAALAVGVATVGLTQPAGAETAPARNVVYLQSSKSGATSQKVTVGSFTYQLRLDHVGSDYTQTSLIVTAEPGVTGRIAGAYRDTDYVRNSAVSTPFDARIAPTAAFSDRVSGTAFKLRYVANGDKLTVTGSDGTRQTLQGSLTARGDESANYRGTGSFTITPS